MILRILLVHEHHLIGVLRYLTARSLVEVSGALTFARACTTWIRCKVHVMTHLYLCLIDGGGYIHHLLHQVLVRHLQILLL